MDVKTAFLNGDLTEEIYMNQPEGFMVKKLENKVCKLNKSLYGLKQAPKLWHEKFDKTVKNLGFVASLSDKCMYCRIESNCLAIICVYVDDMLIIGSNLSIVNDVKVALSSEFDMKDLGVVDTILGMRVRRKGQVITLSQSHYVDNLLHKWGYIDCKPVETPYDYNKRLEPNKGNPWKQLEYSKLIGSLMYAMCCTRPDIAFTVGMLSRFTSNPSEQHWEALDRLMKYLKGTKDYGLCYTGYPPIVEGYSDATWCSDVGDSRSTSGYVYTIGGASVIWKSKRQTSIALSSMESELHALASAGEEAEWVKDLLMDLPLRKLKINNVPVFCDNQATKTVAMNALYNGKRRTLRLKQAYLNFLIDHGYINVIDVRSNENMADALTKGLKNDLIQKFTSKMRLRAI